MARRSRAMEVRWVVTMFPTPAAAEDAGMSRRGADGVPLRRVPARLGRGARADEPDRGAARRGVRGADRRGRHRPDARRRRPARPRSTTACANMPGGEVFVCPLEDSAEGVIEFSEFPAHHAGGARRGHAARLPRRARSSRRRPRSGEEFLLQALATDDGARRLGELGIGCNEGITRPMGSALFDEKIAGTIHLALGGSYTFLGGTNESRIHWDIVKDLRSGGELLFDGELVQRDGAWLI